MDDTLISEQYIIKKWYPDTEGLGGHWEDDETRPFADYASADKAVGFLIHYYSDCPSYQIVRRRVYEKDCTTTRMAGCS